MTALIFFVSAVSHEVYELTTPHVPVVAILVRKTLSVGAFAIVGFFYAAARRRASVREAAVILALYSAAIEVAQFLHGSKEGVGWNTVDVICGGLGGVLGAIAAGWTFAAENSIARGERPRAT